MEVKLFPNCGSFGARNSTKTSLQQNEHLFSQPFCSLICTNLEIPIKVSSNIEQNFIAQNGATYEEKNRNNDKHFSRTRLS